MGNDFLTIKKGSKIIAIVCLIHIFFPINLFSQESSSEPSANPSSLSIKGTQLKFYGFIRLDAIYSDSYLNHPQYSMWVNSEEDGKDNNNFIDIYPRLTRFGFNLHRDSLPYLKTAKLDGTVEMDFQNAGSESRETPRLRHGFLKLGLGSFSILAGQTWDLIAPLWPIVNADGMMWNSGNIGDRRPQLRFSSEPKINDNGVKLQLAAALARTGAIDSKDSDLNGVRDGDDSGQPMTQERVGIVSKLIDIGIWGHQASEKITDTSKTSGKSQFTSSSFGADISIKIKPVTISGEFFQGKNLSDMRGGIGQGINKSKKEIESTGGWGNIKISIKPWLSIGAGISMDVVDTTGLVVGDRKQNKAVFGTIEFDAGGGFVSGLDYINWQTDFVDKPNGTANRYNLYMLYKF